MNDIIDNQIKDAAYYLYTTSSKSKWIKCVKKENFNKIDDYNMYVETAKKFLKNKENDECI